MTKTELVEKTAEHAGISTAAANKALDLSVDGVNPNAA
jgi:nucleoid DNA-binding protein